MHEETVQRLAALRPAIKQRWETLLRSAPAPSPLAHPDLIVYLMDEILDNLAAALADSPEDDDPRAPPTAGPTSSCACGLNPLLPCFITGEQALIELAAPALGPRLNFLLARYHDQAKREMLSFCGVCVHRGSPSCPVQHSGG